jgi:uncharacterized protein (DUF58 family)
VSRGPRTTGVRAESGAGVLALAVLAAAWMIGSTALAVLGVGLLLAVLLARGWSLLAARMLVPERQPATVPPVEGGQLRLTVAVRGATWLASRLELRDRVGPLGELETTVGAGGCARFAVDDVPRGRYQLGPGRLVARDPLGIAAVEIELPAGPTVLVRPRVPEVGALFTDTGARGEGGRRAHMRRPSGLEPHGVREYVEGEPLRAVHWATSARRGQLMVRELEDAPRDSVAIVLDVDAATVTGTPGRSSLDDAVRATAGLVRAHAGRSRRGLLVIASPTPDIHRVQSLGRDWDAALDALAAVEPAEGAPLRELTTARGALGAVPELVVVTARPEVVEDALVARLAVGRSCGLVVVDAPTYAGRDPSTSSRTLLRLAGAGAALVIVRNGDRLEAALGALRERAVG